MLNNVLYHQKIRAYASGSVWIGDDDTAVFSIIILRPYPEIIIERFGFVRYAVDICPDIIERIGDVGKEYGAVSCKEGEKAH